ncbi:MAG: LUD domain-containing protein [Deltaproteobacteria bacterium]|nr:LUD domain-containing protein [Deltaproteobacteria bacterium]
MIEASVLAPRVRAATHRALAARERLVQQYPAWEVWRRQARASKAAALTRLDESIASLKDKVENWGGTVLFARDAAEARELILQVARHHGVRQVVKAKSMTTQEIALTPHLSQAGVEVAETDLGEFIIQLAGHPPAHLTAPALHLDRHQIARLFQDHLGLYCPPEPLALCRAARDSLQERFAAAQMGITGVNFAAVQEGTLVCLENEGNLWQTMARPPVHLAVMGLEKVIPALADLEFFLRLLPASATGQRQTALVHFLNGLKPRLDGGRQSFYLVILDNGRRQMAAHPDLQETLYCLRCGACLNICPVFQAGGAYLYGRIYPGAIGILLARHLRPRGDLSDLCTQCGACGDICPVALELPEKILLVRQTAPRFRRLRLLSRGAGLIMAHPLVYRGLEPGLRAAAKVPLLRAVKFWSAPLAAESFYRQQAYMKRERDKASPGRSWSPPENPEVPSSPGCREYQLPDEGDHFQEAGASLTTLQGPQALARFLAERCSGPVLLEAHELTEPLVPMLAQHGLEARLARSWGEEADTAVTVGLGAVPESGTVLLGPKEGPGAWLPFQARRQVVLIPPGTAALEFAEALKLTAAQAPGLTTWLTGPTRTTDIEKILVLGAQGPVELNVVVYNPEE